MDIQDSPTVKKRVNYAKGSAAQKMEQALNQAYSHPKPNLKQIAESFGVGRQPLARRYQGILPIDASPGKPPLLSHQQEESLTKFLIEVSGLGFGYDLKSLKNLVRNLFNKPSDFFTDGWVQSF